MSEGFTKVIDLGGKHYLCYIKFVETKRRKESQHGIHIPRAFIKLLEG